MGNPTPQKNTIPRSIRGLSLRELFLFTRIPIWKLELLVKGEFKPNPVDREKLTAASLPFYKWNQKEKRMFIQRRKYRELRPFVSITEKANLLDQETDEDYDAELNRLLSKYWDQIITAPFEQGEE